MHSKASNFSITTKRKRAATASNEDGTPNHSCAYECSVWHLQSILAVRKPLFEFSILWLCDPNPKKARVANLLAFSTASSAGAGSKQARYSSLEKGVRESFPSNILQSSGSLKTRKKFTASESRSL